MDNSDRNDVSASHAIKVIGYSKAGKNNGIGI